MFLYVTCNVMLCNYISIIVYTYITLHITFRFIHLNTNMTIIYFLSFHSPSVTLSQYGITLSTDVLHLDFCFHSILISILHSILISVFIPSWFPSWFPFSFRYFETDENQITTSIKVRGAKHQMHPCETKKRTSVIIRKKTGCRGADENGNSTGILKIQNMLLIDSNFILFSSLAWIVIFICTPAPLLFSDNYC